MKQHLNEAIADYLGWRASQDYSKGTLRNERSCLSRFMAVVGNIGVHNIKDRHVTRFFEESGKTRAASSMANDQLCLGRFFTWARHTKRMAQDNDPLYGRRLPKPRKRERYRIHVSRFPHLLEIAGASDARNRALAAVLLYTLCRDQEAADLRVGDVDLEAGYITMRVHKSRIEDRMPISAELDSELRLWLTHYTVEVGPLQDHYHLLPARKSTGLWHLETGKIGGHTCEYLPQRKMGAAGRVLRPILEEVGVPVVDMNGKNAYEGAHTLRRSGARALFDGLVAMGYDQSLRVVQSMLHHSSQTTTEAYIGITADRRTRDDLIKGRTMYANAQSGSVISLAR